MAGYRTWIGLWVGAFFVCATLSGCDEISRFIEDTVGATEAQPPPPAEPADEEVEEKLPERPATSTARSETQVITFRSILDNRELSREEYLRLNPRQSVPTIKIGDEVIVGFSAQAVNTALNAAARSRLN
jgi:glutaredoxin